VTLLLNLWWAMHLLRLRGAELVAASWRPFVACACMFVVVAGLRSVWPGQGILAAALEALVAFVAGAVSYCLSILLLWWWVGRPPGAEAKLLELGGAYLHRFTARARERQT
jgi:hypothetical protein